MELVYATHNGTIEIIVPLNSIVFLLPTRSIVVSGSRSRLCKRDL